MKDSLAIIFTILLSAASCGRKQEPGPTLRPEMEEVEVSEVRFHNARLSAGIKGLTGEETCGFEVAQAGSVDKQEYVVAPEEGLIQRDISGLAEDTEYSVRAFADNGANIRVFSNAAAFRTAKLPDPSQIIPIEDPVFKKWLVVRYDSNSDGEISYEEAREITHIDVCTEDIYSLKGIEYFTNLSDVNLSGGRDEQGSWTGKLTEADLTQNKALTSITLNGNKLTSLDLGGLTELNHIGISSNPFKTISFESQRRAVIIGCSNTDITECDLAGMDMLEEMHLDGNRSLESVTLDNKKLVYLDLTDCALRSLDISRCPVLNALSTKDNPNLEYIYMSRAQAISSLTKDSHTTIKYVD